MTWIDLFCLSLATAAASRTWFEGSLFAEQRSLAEAWADIEPETRGQRVRVFFAELLSCSFCLSHHLALWLVLLYAASLLWGGFWLRLPIYWLAVVHLAGWLWEREA